MGQNTRCCLVFFSVNLRNGAVTVAADGLHQPGRGHFFTQVVMSVCGQPVVAVDQGHEGEGFREAGKLQLLKTRGHSVAVEYSVYKRDVLQVAL